MSNLGPQKQNASYAGLLQVPGGITATLQTVTDGDGNPTGLQLSATAVSALGVISSTAQNLYGGFAGQLVYQTGSGATGFVSTGTTGQLLQSNGLATPTFVSVTASTVGALPTTGGAMTGAIDMNANLITDLATPVASTDAATKGYVDSVATGLQPKTAVTCASTANITTLSGLLTIDGVTVTAGQRVLVKDQSTAANNGIYVAAVSTWARATDADTWSELVGAAVFVSSGTANANTTWVTNIPSTGTIGVTAITFVQFSAAQNYTAGTGLTLAGSQFSLTTPVAIANGGTNSTATPTAGAVAYGTGTAIGYTSAGSTGQFLKSNGSSAPSFISITAGDVSATPSTVVASVDSTSISNALTRPPSDMLGDFRSIADFAPAGSLSNASYDWTTAIQNAVNSLGAGGTVYFPSKATWYRANGTITVNNINTLIDGCNATIEMMADTTLFLVTQENVTVKDLKINCNAGITLSASSYIVDTSTASTNLRIENITATTLGSGFRVRGNYFRITNCQLDGICSNGYGTYINCTGPGDGIGWITACTFTGTPSIRPKACVFADDGSAVQITSCEFEQSQVALWLQPAVGVAAIGSYMCTNTFFDTFDNAGVLFDNTVNPTANFQRMVFTGNWFSNGGATAGVPTGTGLQINSGCEIDSVLIADSEFFGNNIGIYIGDNCVITNTEITGCVFSGTLPGVSPPANAEISIGRSNENFIIDGCHIGTAGGYLPSTNGLYINPGCVDFIVSNNRIYKATFAGDSTSSTAYFVFDGNSIDSTLTINSYCSNYIIDGNKISTNNDSGAQPKHITNNLIYGGTTSNNGLAFSNPTDYRPGHNPPGDTRILNTTYPNNLPYPIFVTATIANGTPGATDYIVAEVNGIPVQGPGGNSVPATVSFPVPPGSSYKLYNLYGYLTTITAWAEYR